MKKLVALFVVLAAFLSFNNNTFSQPQVIIHVTGGYNVPLPDLKGDLMDSADNVNTFIMNGGYNAGADVKYYLGKKRNVGITLALSYNGFSNSADSTNYSDKAKLNAFTAGLGIEYNFMPKGKTKPFLGAEFTGNFYSGNREFTVGTFSYKRDLKSASRFGIAIGGGLDFAFSKGVGAVVGVKYNLSNLIGKDNDTTGMFDPNSTEYNLIDKELTLGTVTFPSKSISYIQLYAGLSFFLNQPKTKVKK